MNLMEWGAIGAVMFALFIFCARIMRRGISVLDDERKKQMEIISEGQRKIDEEKRNITADEQIRLARAAAEDLLRLEGLEKVCQLKADCHIIDLRCPDGDWRLQLLMRETSLRSRRKTLCGQSRWLLLGENAHEEYGDIAGLMAALARRLRGERREEDLPKHIARRLAATRAMRGSGG